MEMSLNRKFRRIPTAASMGGRDDTEDGTTVAASVAGVAGTRRPAGRRRGPPVQGEAADILLDSPALGQHICRRSVHLTWPSWTQLHQAGRAFT